MQNKKKGFTEMPSPTLDFLSVISLWIPHRNIFRHLSSQTRLRFELTIHYRGLCSASLCWQWCRGLCLFVCVDMCVRAHHSSDSILDQ